MVGLGGAIAALLASGVFQALGEYLSKIWGLSPTWTMAAFAVLAYAVSSLIWLPALLYRDQLSTIGIAWDLVAVFDDPFPRPRRFSRSAFGSSDHRHCARNLRPVAALS